MIISIIGGPTAAFHHPMVYTHPTTHHFSRSDLSYSTPECPTWQQWNRHWNESTRSCECGRTLNGIVNCSRLDNSVRLLACYCMTESELLNKTIIGNCLYTCSWNYWTRLPNVTSELDTKTCSPLKRTGQLCGHCVDNHAPPVYSYNIECVKCTNYSTNWLRYIAVAFLPLTIFYVIIVVFRISASTPKLRCLILVSQIAAMPGHLRYLYTLEQNYMEGMIVSKKFINVGLSLFAIWNLDFFRAVYHPFCIHPNIGSLGVLALDYLTAMYPLILIFATYCCINFYDNYSIIRWLLKPLHRCCFYFRKEWKIHHSLTDAFATFLMLSYVKVLNISFDLLLPTTIYDMNGERISSFLYYSGTIKIFKNEHIPFAILACFMAIVFNIFPLILLCLYPCRCFQKVIHSCKCHSQTLHVFMDIFHGCYRTKPLDYRYFTVVYLLIRIINLAIFSSTLSRFYYPFTAVLSLFAAFLVTITQPYKHSVYNKLDACLFILLACAYIPATAYALSPSDKFNNTFIVMMFVIFIVLLSYMASLIFYWAIPLRMKELIKLRVKRLYQKEQAITMEEDFLESVYPFRNSQPTDTTTLLPQ